MSLHSFLTRLIGLCVVPLVILAAYLAFDHVRTIRSARDVEAANLARNFATAIDHDLSARIAALNMLALSPLADEPSRWQDFYREALAFHASFGTHVVFVDLRSRMLFNTRVPDGAALPQLPKGRGTAAAATAMETGKPAVGDLSVGPGDDEPLVAIAVPVLREGRTAFVLLTTLTVQQLQDRLEKVVLPLDWSLALVDGTGEIIARRAPANGGSASFPDGVRFVAESTASPWSVILEIPRGVYQAPVMVAALALAIALLGATLASVLGGMLASRRLGREVASLAATPGNGTPAPEIADIAAARRLLDESADRRERAEAALRHSEQRFRATFEQAAMGIALVSPDGRFLRVNRKLCDVLGYPQEEMLTRTFHEITSPQDLGADLVQARKVLAGELDVYAMEKRYLRKDGALMWGNLTVALVRRADGEPDYFISVIEDIGRRKQTEAALTAREASLREAQRLAGVGNWSWDLLEDRHCWSEEIYRIYGRDQALGPALYPEVQAYFTPESWAGLADVVDTALARGTAYEYDAEVVRPDGTHRWITARGEALRDAEGKVVELHGTVQDITERKLAAEALREFAAGLEQHVEARTAELTSANRELDSFAYAVSHDLRAPLRAMSGFAQALVEDYGDRLDGQAKIYLDQIGIASRKMGELIDGILALSRSTRGDLRRETVDVSEMASTLLEAFVRGEPARTVTVQVEPGLTVEASPRMTEAVLQNLLDNAWKYTRHTADPAIRVYVGEVGGLRGICVADNGAGFDMAHAQQLFQPFRRLHRQDEFPGIGIGLATVQRIVHRHGGDIRAAAAPGKGATFCFTLASESVETTTTVGIGESS